MMILGESNRPNPTVQIPSWTLVFDDPTAGMVYGHDGGGGGGGGPGDCSPFVLGDTFAAALHLHRYLPSNAEDSGPGPAPGRESDFALALDDEYSSSDEFRMFEFKVRRCGRGRAHDWTECPFAHLGEKAKRRDPRKFHYSGTACPDFRKGSCRRGEACDYAHGVFECWLHPARYRTQPCKDGIACRRRVCFFAHTPDQLRLLPHHHQHSPKAASASVESYDGSPLLKAASLASSPTSTLVSPPFSPSSDSPPLSPNGPSIRRGMLSNSVNEVLAFSLRQLQLSNAKSSSPWGVQVFSSSPSTPTTALKTAGMGLGRMDLWEKEAETMDRVESGRDLRAKVFEKLSRENAVTPDVGWVSELVK